MRQPRRTSLLLNPPWSRSFERCRFDHQYWVACAGDASYDQTFTTLDRDRDARRITQLGEFGEERRDVFLGVLDHPGLDYHPVVVDCADAAAELNPNPIRRNCV